MARSQVIASPHTGIASRAYAMPTMQIQETERQ